MTSLTTHKTHGISRIALTIAAGLSFFIAAFQIFLTFNTSLSRAFGAPQVVLDNPVLMLVAGVVMTLLFVLLGVYALSGAGYVRPLPLLRLALLAIGLVFVFRGLRMFIEPLLEPVVVAYPPEEIMSTVAALATGAAYLVGVAGLLSREQKQ